MTGRLQGKVAVIVGAGQTPGETIGNGHAMALMFGREGASILCVDRHDDRARGVAQEIAENGGQASPCTANIAKSEDCAAIVEASLAAYGRIDILVNNAGIGGGDAPAHAVADEAWERILGVNLTGMMRMVRAALRPMRAQRSGSIVNISSLASIAGGNQVAYEVSKAGVNRLTTSVAQANARYGIRCNAVAPGLMDTPMAVSGIAAARGVSEADVRAERDARVPLGGRMGTAWDTAFAALYLASDEAAFVTGVILPVDGGMGVRIG